MPAWSCDDRHLEADGASTVVMGCATDIDFSNISRLTPDEIARRRAEFDHRKEITKTVRAKPHAAQ